MLAKLSLVLFIFLFSCKGSQNSDSTHNFDWLLGNWIRTNGAQNITTGENWKKLSETEYMGLGYNLKANDTSFKESIRLYKNKDFWVYEVSGVNEQPTEFRMTSSGNNEFTLENSSNDFPKKIQYTYNEKSLKATISDNNRSIIFEFSRSAQ
ncbi:DUF6265 family protein [Christiangramia salexigens]|uniref:DUF6265 domain-containing protein n=1 Tax=Christiangramia salexigens TaxID=1913577 RepID=A0A1L3J764_9FLAO|nr:DUF6265 family protein [Christiangramia salexigens]APG60958.1 hypothetical protein LPB144_11290 [Christiangramia salexigens]